MQFADGAERVPLRAALLGALFAALVTLPGLGIGTLWDNSETAYGEVAREILVTHDWLVMHLNGKVWFVQPPLYFWIAAIFAKIFGVGTFAMRLPAALATVAMGGAVGYATARISTTRSGIYAAVILSTSLMQAIVGRLAIMDALLDLTVAGAILWWFRAFEPQRIPGALSDAGKRNTAFILGAVAIALGMLSKGPVAPVITALVVAGWLVWEYRVHATLVLPPRATLLAACGVFVLVAAPWFALLVGRMGTHAVIELIGHYTVGRYTGVIENQSGPFWYYIPVLILGFFPWIAFLPVGLARAWRTAQEPEGALARLALVWTVLPLVFFSFAQTKLPNYVALEMPALAIIVGLWFEQISAGVDKRAALISAATVPLTVGCIAVAVVLFGKDNHLQTAVSQVAPQLITLAAGMLVGSLATVIAIADRRWRPNAPYVLAATSLALVFFIGTIAEPKAEELKPIPPLAKLINAERQPGDIVAIRGVSGGNALTFYTAPGVRGIKDTAQSYVDVICPTGRAFIVTRSTDLAELRSQTTQLNRAFNLMADTGKVALIRIDGPDCPHD